VGSRSVLDCTNQGQISCSESQISSKHFGEIFFQNLKLGLVDHALYVPDLYQFVQIRVRSRVQRRRSVLALLGGQFFKILKWDLVDQAL
jgi:hypothetical protein